MMNIKLFQKSIYNIIKFVSDINVELSITKLIENSSSMVVCEDNKNLFIDRSNVVSFIKPVYDLSNILITSMVYVSDINLVTYLKHAYELLILFICDTFGLECTASVNKLYNSLHASNDQLYKYEYRLVNFHSNIPINNKSIDNYTDHDILARYREKIKNVSAGSVLGLKKKFNINSTYNIRNDFMPTTYQARLKIAEMTTTYGNGLSMKSMLKFLNGIMSNIPIPILGDNTAVRIDSEFAGLELIYFLFNYVNAKSIKLKPSLAPFSLYMYYKSFLDSGNLAINVLVVGLLFGQMDMEYIQSNNTFIFKTSSRSVTIRHGSMDWIFIKNIDFLKYCFSVDMNLVHEDLYSFQNIKPVYKYIYSRLDKSISKDEFINLKKISKLRDVIDIVHKHTHGIDSCELGRSNLHNINSISSSSSEFQDIFVCEILNILNTKFINHLIQSQLISNAIRPMYEKTGINVPKIIYSDRYMPNVNSFKKCEIWLKRCNLLEKQKNNIDMLEVKTKKSKEFVLKFEELIAAVKIKKGNIRKTYKQLLLDEARFNDMLNNFKKEHSENCAGLKKADDLYHNHAYRLQSHNIISKPNITK